MWVQVPPAVLTQMAPQKKSHTQNQLQSLNNKFKCSSCGFATYRVLESRVVLEGRRRRYGCDRCGHRETLYEINSVSYSEFISLKSKFSKFLKIINDVKIVSQIDISVGKKLLNDCPCSDCFYYHDTLTDQGFKCSYDLPEAGSSDAVGCNLFEKI